MEQILYKAERLIELYKQGRLGGERMPEDSSPSYPRESIENYLFFTLPMALNYQRSSYALWESAHKTALDKETEFVFQPKKCIERPFSDVQEALTKYKVALQRNKQTEIWIRLCETLANRFNGDVRILFDENGNDIACIKQYVQKSYKKDFPYLSGDKICNYWLYVLHNYTDRCFVNLGALTVAPDTHVCQATLKLGLISEEEYHSAKVQEIVAVAWERLFEKTEHYPIDIHTPLWLWSRGGFPDIE